MSHTTVVYPQSTGGLTFAPTSSVRVCEEEGEYLSFSKVLLRYTDRVEEKLPQARTVALLLRDPQLLPPGGLEDAGALIAELIDDVLLAHKAMWAEYKRERQRKG